MSRPAFRFPLTVAAAVVAAAAVAVAVFTDFGPINLPLGPLTRIPRGAVDEVVFGLVLLAAAVAIDVTRARRAVAEHAREIAQAAEIKYRTLFAENPLPMWTFDRSTLRFVEVNEAAVQHYGYTRDEFLAMTIQDIRPAEDIERLTAVIRREGSSWSHAGTWNHRLKSGRIIDVEIMSHLVTAADRPATLVVAQDVTERKLLERQFQQAQKMEAIGQLAGGVAHDFNNLLTVILGYCQILIDNCGDDTSRREDLTEIHKAGTSAASLTAQLLAFSRKQLATRRVLDPNSVIEEMVKMLQRLVGSNIEISLRLATDTGRVKADPGQLHQVIMNLVVNARDAMPDGGRLTIETANVDLDQTYVTTHFSVEPGPFVLLAISDTGTGMSPETQARLFDPFFTTKEPGKGTGLGLASVYGIVKQNEGSVWVYSEVGRGSTFKVYLPRVSDAAEAAGRPVERRIRTHDETVLLVEDEPVLQKLTARILQGDGYSVLTAGTAAEALEICSALKAPIHLLLTDIIMPGISGPALAKRLLADRPQMKVICMSGYAPEAVIEHGVLDDTLAFLQKPFSPEALLRRVDEELSHE